MDVFEFLSSKKADKFPDFKNQVDQAGKLDAVDPHVAKLIVQSGLQDGDPSDDKLSVSKGTWSAADLKPSQTTMVLAHALSIALTMLKNGKVGGDLGALISKDNHILDGHHRWAGTIFAAGKNGKVGGYGASLPGKDLIKVLNVVSKGMFNVQRGNKGKGNLSEFTESNARKMLHDLAENGQGGSYPWTPEQIQEVLKQNFGSVEKGIDTMAKRAKLIPKSAPSWAPPRTQMPVIEPSEAPAAAKALTQGEVDWNDPHRKEARMKRKARGERLPDFKKQIDQAGQLDKVDPSVAKLIVQSGLQDGNSSDDKVSIGKGSWSAASLKPSQTSMVLGKALGMALFMLKSGKIGGDLGALVSKDGHILDGHHRWAATIFASGSKGKVGGYGAALPGKELLKVLNVVSKGLFNVRNGKAGKGALSEFKEGNVRKMLTEFTEKGIGGAFPWSPESVREVLEQNFGSVEKGIDEMSKNAKYITTTVPGWAPDRKQMPVIEPNEVPSAAKSLNRGEVDWNDPHRKESAADRKQLIRLASTLPEGDEMRKVILAGLKAAATATIGKGKNGYIAIYKRKRVEVMADTKLEAQQAAAKHFKARKPYDVAVELAEKDGKQVTHKPLMASRTFTASDRKHLIRYASSLSEGSDERRAILAGLKAAAFGSYSDYDEAFVEAVELSNKLRRPVELWKNKLFNTFSVRLFLIDPKTQAPREAVRGEIIKPGTPLTRRQKEIQRQR